MKVWEKIIQSEDCKKCTGKCDKDRVSECMIANRYLPCMLNDDEQLITEDEMDTICAKQVGDCMVCLREFLDSEAAWKEGDPEPVCDGQINMSEVSQPR